jgi:Trypsin-co-occurring domain 2
MSQQGLALADVVKALRSEILEAAQAGQNEDIRFNVGAIEVEFTVAVKREGGPNGKVKFEVFGIGAELGADAKFARESSQKVKLTLNPHKLNSDGTIGELNIAKPLKPETAANP